MAATSPPPFAKTGLVEEAGVADDPDFGGADQRPRRQPNRVDLGLDLGFPEVQQTPEFRIVGREVVALDRGGLQNAGVVGHVIENLGGGQPIPS